MPKNPNLLEESLKMQGTSLILTMSLASILTVALLSAVPNQAFAQQVDFEYRCYNTSDILLPDQPSDILTLIDQFGTRDYNVLKAVEFCNPAIKSPEGNPAADPLSVLPHLRCWALGDKPALGIVVTLNDQFSDIPVEHTILKAVEFCHTTTKGMRSLSGPAGPVFYDETANNHSPIHVANWICYDLSDKNTPAEPFRKLKDQFTITGANSFDPDGIEVGPALFLCTPAIKMYQGGTFPPGVLGSPGGIKALDQHMKCYDIVGEGLVNLGAPGQPATPGIGFAPVATFPDETIPLDDQFAQFQSSKINKLDKICLDVIKETAIAGTFIPIESIAILLAGAHMSSAWIIPALIALAGVGYGIEIARKYRKDTK